MTAVQDKWLSPAEAARRLGLTTQRIRQLMTAGILRHEWTPIGRLVDAAAVESLRLERKQRKGGAA